MGEPTTEYRAATLRIARAITIGGDWPASVFEGPHALTCAGDRDLERFAAELVRQEDEAAASIGRLVDVLVSEEIVLLNERASLPWFRWGRRERLTERIKQIEQVLAKTPDRKFQQRVMARIRLEEQRA